VNELTGKQSFWELAVTYRTADELSILRAVTFRGLNFTRPKEAKF